MFFSRILRDRFNMIFAINYFYWYNQSIKFIHFDIKHGKKNWTILIQFCKRI